RRHQRVLPVVAERSRASFGCGRMRDSVGCGPFPVPFLAAPEQQRPVVGVVGDDHLDSDTEPVYAHIRYADGSHRGCAVVRLAAHASARRTSMASEGTIVRGVRHTIAGTAWTTR